MVRIRLSRMGRTHRPFYRINAIEKRNQRDGKILENLGWYNPIEADETKQVSLKEERIRHWLSVGAQPSDTCATLLANAGILKSEDLKAKHEKRFGRKMEKMKADAAAAKAAEEAAAKAEAEAKAKEEAEAKAAAEAKAKEEAAAAAAAPAEGEEEKSE